MAAASSHCTKPLTVKEAQAKETGTAGLEAEDSGKTAHTRKPIFLCRQEAEELHQQQKVTLHSHRKKNPQGYLGINGLS